MSVDKVYCMSSYLAFRYVEDTTKLFFPGLHHNRMPPIPEKEKKPVRTALEIDAAIGQTFSLLQKERLGLLLSGGMDSAILASYMPGCDAYTFRFLGHFRVKNCIARSITPTAMLYGSTMWISAGILLNSVLTR